MTGLRRGATVGLTGRVTRITGAAGIPKRYAGVSFEGFEAKLPRSHRSLQAALVTAKKFAEQYPIDTDGKGLLFIGPNGTGKTTLAISLLKALLNKGVDGLFVTYGELLKKVQNSYNPSVRETELDILRPVFDAEILVIDELGSSKPTEWVMDTVGHILNSRYNDEKTTIITTNFANERELISVPADLKEQQAIDAWRAMYKDNLGDRIGERMRSRLQEMCVAVEMHGEDYRETNKKASVNNSDIYVAPPLPAPVLVSTARASLPDEVAALPPKEDDPVGPARMGSFSRRFDVSGSD